MPTWIENYMAKAAVVEMILAPHTGWYLEAVGTIRIMGSFHVQKFVAGEHDLVVVDTIAHELGHLFHLTPAELSGDWKNPKETVFGQWNQKLDPLGVVIDGLSPGRRFQNEVEARAVNLLVARAFGQKDRVEEWEKGFLADDPPALHSLLWIKQAQNPITQDIADRVIRIIKDAGVNPQIPRGLRRFVGGVWTRVRETLSRWRTS